MKENTIKNKARSIYNTILITSGSLLCSMPVNVLAEATEDANIPSYNDFYYAIHDPVGSMILNSKQGTNYATNLNDFYNWGMELVQFGYYFAFAVAIIALVVSIVRMIIGSDNPKVLTECRHNILVSLITIACLGIIGAIFLLILQLLSF